VFHAAAVLDDAPLAQLDLRQIATAFGAKARGAWLLHQYTRALELDHFVLFSSVAALVGGPGQGSYAMACAYLDALAHYRRARNLPAISVNWGALADVGMATRYVDAEKYLASSGVGLFTPAQAVKLLGRVLAWNPIDLGAAKMNWQAWAALYPTWSASPKYGALHVQDVQVQAGHAETDLHRRLSQLGAAERETAVLEVLVGLLATTLATTSDAIDVSVSLPSMGMDSLMAMDLQLAIEQSFAFKISMLELMKGNNAIQLAVQIAAALQAAPIADQQAQAPLEWSMEMDVDSAERFIAGLDAMSDGEVDRLLAKLMQREELEV
jgi:acyl carrier protein